MFESNHQPIVRVDVDQQFPFGSGWGGTGSGIFFPAQRVCAMASRQLIRGQFRYCHDANKQPKPRQDLG